MHHAHHSTSSPGGSPRPHLPRSPGRALDLGRRITVPSYLDLYSVSSRLRVRGACADAPSQTGSGMDKMLPTLTPAGTQVSAPRSPTRPSRGLPPRAALLRRRPTPSCAACPGRALPRYALLRAAAAGHRGVLGEPPSPRASSGRRRSRRAVGSEVPIPLPCLSPAGEAQTRSTPMQPIMQPLAAPSARRGGAARTWHMPSRRASLLAGLLSALLLAAPA